MEHEFPQPFAQNYERLLKRLKLCGMQPKTIESYSHGVRRAGAHFKYQIDDLNRDQLTDYFAEILDKLSWSTLKTDLYGLKFYYAYVLDKPWPGAELTKAPKVSRLPDIVTVAQMQQIVSATRIISYRVFFFVLYSAGGFTQLYTTDAYFKDPFNEVRGHAAINTIFAHMFKKVDAPKFVVTRSLLQNNDAFLVWEFLFYFKGEKAALQKICGSSHLRFSPEHKVEYHRDYWDAAEELYEKIPLLGSVMRFIKRMANK